MEVLEHDRGERAIGGDDAIGGSRTGQDGAPQRQIAGALQPRPAGTGRAKLLEALWVEHERRRACCAPSSRVPQHARAEAVHDVDAAFAHELERLASCP